MCSLAVEAIRRIATFPPQNMLCWLYGHLKNRFSLGEYDILVVQYLHCFTAAIAAIRMNTFTPRRRQMKKLCRRRRQKHNFRFMN
jgi:hypothetical protein